MTLSSYGVRGLGISGETYPVPLTEEFLCGEVFMTEGIGDVEVSCEVVCAFDTTVDSDGR